MYLCEVQTATGSWESWRCHDLQSACATVRAALKRASICRVRHVKNIRSTDPAIVEQYQAGKLWGEIRDLGQD